MTCLEIYSSSHPDISIDVRICIVDPSTQNSGVTP